MRSSILTFLFFLIFSLANAQSGTGWVSVDTIEFTGNTRTKERILLREMTFFAGDSIPQAKFDAEVERSRQNLFNLHLFLTVTAQIISLPDAPNRVKVVMEVKEKLYFFSLPIFYLADRNFSEWWYERGRDLRRTTYGLNTHHDNLTGNNDKMQLRLYGGFIPYYELTYGRPYIDKKQRLGIQGGVFFSTQRSLPYRTWEDKLDFIRSEERVRQRTGAFVRYNYRANLYHFHSLHTGYTDMQVADTIALLNPNYFLNGATRQRFFTLSYDYRLDRRDNKQYALKGDVIFAQITYQHILDLPNPSLTSIQAGIVEYIPISKRWFFDGSVRFRHSFPDIQPYVQTIGLGFSANLVRGYELNVIDGQTFFLGKTNFKYKLFDKVFDLSKLIKIKQFNTLPVASYAVFYADAGYVRNTVPENSNTSLGNRWLVGGGVGLDIITFYNTIGRFNYSVNREGEGRVYFTVLRGF